MKPFSHDLHTGPIRFTAACRASTVTALLVAALLAGCQPKPETVAPEVRSAEPTTTADPTVGQRIDNVMADAQRKTEQAGAGLAKAADQAGVDIKDAGITAAVVAKLAADPALHALRINVNTAAGRVSLSGDAPDVASRDRAAQLARSVDGVTDVDNQLTIQSKG